MPESIRFYYSPNKYVMMKPHIAYRYDWINKSRYAHYVARIKKEWLSSTAFLYDRTVSCISKDIEKLEILIKYGDIVLIPSAQLKAKIRARDNFTCQYCGKVNPKHSAIEHVIPCIRGGCTEAYNLVFSCKSCNDTKKRQVWEPDNIDEITQDKPDWAAKIRSMSAPRKKKKKI